MDIRVTTYKDLIDHCLDFLGANPDASATRDCRRAIQNGYRDLASRHRWAYYYTRGRLNTVAPFQDGTIAYSQATRTVTLTPQSSSGFPVWAGQGMLVITNVVYEVATSPTSTTLILTQQSNPGADVAPGQVYTLYQDTYPLPVDCQAIDRLILVNNAFSMWYEHPSSWLERQRIYRNPAVPRSYTIRGTPDYLGSLAISFYPVPDNIYNFDYIYQRRPRPLLKDQLSAGAVSTTTGTLTVTGTGTTWDPSLVGSVVRVGSDNVNLPTGLSGSYPAHYERIIVAVPTTTSLTVDATFDASVGPVKYLISDPVDMEELSMLTALQRSVEFQLSQSRNKESRAQALADYKMALIEAMEADSRNFAMESSGSQRMFPYRLANMPRGPDIS
jgi:hypothetical protein